MNYRNFSGGEYEPGEVLYEKTGSIALRTAAGQPEELMVISSSNSAVLWNDLNRLAGYEIPSEDCILFPNFVIVNKPGEYAGYITAMPHFQGKLMTLDCAVAEWRYDDIYLGNVAGNLIRCFHQVEGVKNYKGQPVGLLLGIPEMQDFLADETGRVYYLGTGLRNNRTWNEARYPAPEMITNWDVNATDRYTQMSDSFVLGCMLFEILTGRNPFGTGDREEILRNIRRGKSLLFDPRNDIYADVLDKLERRLPNSVELFLNCLDYCGCDNYIQNRPGVNDWYKLVTKQEDRDGYTEV